MLNQAHTQLLYIKIGPPHAVIKRLSNNFTPTLNSKEKVTATERELMLWRDYLENILGFI